MADRDDDILSKAQNAPQGGFLGCSLCVQNHVVLIVGDEDGEPIAQIHLTPAEVLDTIERLKVKLEQLRTEPKPHRWAH
jgi:hypothetical protein